jgi:dihydroneopterin aldolase
MGRDALIKLIKDHLTYATDTSKIRGIMKANNWKTPEDIRKKASDKQIEAIQTVWGLDAYVT